jgi:adenine deaminase
MNPVLRAARGEKPADIVYTNLTLFNPFVCAWEDTSFAVSDGVVLGTGDYRGIREYDLGGAAVVPGFIDAHVHIESSLLIPGEFGRAVLGHGTTTVIADPHEIANVAGIEGIQWMLSQRDRTPLDIFYMLPSCVPATPLDRGWAVLSAADLKRLLMDEGILGLGEMMNVPGVLSGDPEVREKLNLCPIRDGHAPLLSGNDLNAYILAGIQSDHETTTVAEAREKLRKGMYLMIREGSTERNIRDVIPVVDACSVSRCSFATDDRHADMLLEEGHIDDCIRKAIDCGLEPEFALRMGTLSAAERFGLLDRGALAPGMLADFCIVDPREFTVKRTFKRGEAVQDRTPLPPPPLRVPMACPPISEDRLTLEGSGEARVIALVENQIITREERVRIDAADIPDTGRDILKAIVCDRYRGSGCGVGLVRGFGLSEGAIAASVSHDSHNIVGAGADDGDIIAAVRAVIRHGGGMAVASGGRITLLPLEIGGLMSSRSFEDVAVLLANLNRHCTSLGGIDHPFMYLSFIALTVIPDLRLTARGLFDVCDFVDVPLFVA